MKKLCLLLCSAALLSGCSYNQFGAVASGSGIGGMFGSAIGGILGGHRGSDAGAVIGMVVGGATGAAVSSGIENSRERRSHNTAQAPDYGRHDDVTYSRTPSAPAGGRGDWALLDVVNVNFSDRNGNRALDAGEEAYLTFEIYNRSERTLYDIAPQISCSSSQVQVSPSAIISAIAPHQGVRYKAVVRASRRLKSGSVQFSVAFGDGRQAMTAKTFSISTRR
ncbi:MAG: hypothetical protein IJ722_00880 [Alloprevotella sp.]|nr:hypothetical protein [Alloprevotella sp.]